MEVSALDIADAESSQYGDIDAGADDVHLPAVGMRCLDIVNAYRDEREARGIDQHIENGSHGIALRTEAQEHLHEYCKARPTMAPRISHRETSYRRFIHFMCNRVIPRMRIFMSINRKQANCSKYNVSISFLFLYLASAKIIVNTLKRMQKYKFYFEMRMGKGKK